MNLRSESSARVALQIWQSRQRADGTLLAVLVVAGVFAMLRFAFSPGSDSAWLMGIILVALGMACLRLLNSAAMVVRIRESFCPAFVPEIVEAEILDVYEHPLALDAPSVQRTSIYWLPPGREQASDPQQAFSPNLLRIGQGTCCHARNRGRK